MRKLSDAELAASRLNSAQVGMQITVGKTLDQNMLHQIVASIVGQHDSITSGTGALGILIRQRDASQINPENQHSDEGDEGEELEPYLSIQLRTGSAEASSDS